MKAICTYNVLASLPERLQPIKKLAYNLRFSWHHGVSELFKKMDPSLWAACNGNPVHMLGAIRQGRLEELARDAGFVAEMDQCAKQLDAYLSAPPKGYGRAGEKCCIAYFSAEFGLSECLPIYSGGLGILAADHLKSASDLNLPLVGVGLFYNEGFFKQYLNADGWQQEAYPPNDTSVLPLVLVKGENNEPIKVEVLIKGAKVKIQIWKVLVGRIPLYLLDTNCEENSPAHRPITARLYGGDIEMRLSQEIVLGIGGVRALRAMGIEATAYHMNEGHSAFSALERIRILQEEGLSFDAARELVVATNTFTTHTPVPAGIDMFSPEQMHAYFGHYMESVGIASRVFLGFGRQDPMNDHERFSMPVLALRLSAHSNGVSKLHAKVSRDMWHRLWPKNPKEDIPVKPITNGIHIPSWISKGMADLFARHLGRNWIEDPDCVKVWKQVDKISDQELWETHEQSRRDLVGFARKRLHAQLTACGISAREVETARQVLNPDILTIGFARRFAGYKRATLLLHDEPRLIRLLNNPERPMQIIMAGKSHPHDNLGKDLIRRLVHFASRPEVRNRFVFIQDYNIAVARMLVQGADVWLNTPRRPMEACGTSGMKALPNGVLNLSVLDGWWDEGYDPRYGWAIGAGETYDDPDMQDEIESRALYNLLERDIVPLFYDRGDGNLPNGWLVKMKAAMTDLCPVFNTHRMVQDYQEVAYNSASRRYNDLSGEDKKGARELAVWRQKLMTNWDRIRISRIQSPDHTRIPASTKLKIEADVYLQELTPDDVSVEIYFGPLNQQDEFDERETVQMEVAGSDGKGNHHFVGSIPCQTTGHFGFTIRVMPSTRKMEMQYTTGLVVWANPDVVVRK